MISNNKEERVTLTDLSQTLYILSVELEKLQEQKSILEQKISQVKVTISVCKALIPHIGE